MMIDYSRIRFDQKCTICVITHDLLPEKQKIVSITLERFLFLS